MGSRFAARRGSAVAGEAGGGPGQQQAAQACRVDRQAGQDFQKPCALLGGSGLWVAIADRPVAPARRASYAGPSRRVVIAAEAVTMDSAPASPYLVR